MKRILVTRSEPGASETGERLAALGLKPIIEPVFAVEPVAAGIPAFDALAFTSANGVRAFAKLNQRRDLPVFCVGGRTAKAAREAGFADVQSAEGDIWTLVRLITGRLPAGANLLHSGNEETRGDLAGQLRARGIPASFVVTYRAVPLAAPGPELAVHLRGTTAFDAVLVHSPRGASILAGFLNGASSAAPIDIAAISVAAAEPLRMHARRIETASAPNEDALLKALMVLCDLG
jgi:uroporphyrinogen-III synthase